MPETFITYTNHNLSGIGKYPYCLEDHSIIYLTMIYCACINTKKMCTTFTPQIKGKSVHIITYSPMLTRYTGTSAYYLINLRHCTHLIGVQKSLKSADFFDTVILSHRTASKLQLWV